MAYCRNQMFKRNYRLKRCVCCESRAKKPPTGSSVVGFNKAKFKIIIIRNKNRDKSEKCC